MTAEPDSPAQDLLPPHAEITAAAGSNLALSFTSLPKETREAMSVFYAFCRVLDDIADDPAVPVATKRGQLAAWHEEIRRCYTGEPRTPLGREMAAIIKRYLIPPTPLQEIINGCEMDMDRDRYATFAELEQYCYRVASAVGLVSIEIFTYRHEQTKDYAVALGMAFQLTNILRDIRKDAEEMGRIYLPREELDAFGVSEQEILDGVWSERLRQLCRFQHHRARHFYAKSWRLIHEEDRPNLLAAEIMREVYGELLHEIERRDFDVFREEVRHSKPRKAWLVWRAHRREKKAAPTPPRPKRVLVLGAGMAGLAAAWELNRRGHDVTVLEARRLLGGRAHSFADPKSGQEIDNGQHILMGCYKETLKLIDDLGASERLLRPEALDVPYLSKRGAHRLAAPEGWPAPLHLAVALLRFGELDWNDRWAAVQLSVRLQLGQNPRGSETARDWLIRWKQTPNLVRAVWEPLCIAALNEPVETATATLFATVVRRALLGGAEDSKILIGRVGFSQLFPPETRRLLEMCGGHLLTGAQVRRLDFDGDRLAGVETADGQRFEADHVVSTLPWKPLGALLPEDAPLRQATAQLASSPIVSLHVWLDRPIMEGPFLGLLDSPVHWVFNRRAIDAGAPAAPGKDPVLADAWCYSVVVSGARELMEMSSPEIEALALRELGRFLPEVHEARPLHRVVYKSADATFATTPEAEAWRPEPTTPWRNFWLAGDWTNTGLPATIEGAVLSGRRAAACVDRA
ncbi:MAG: hydroxysqualene dehydroxylase HpnE [Verrucomicrobiota bacterium]